MKVKYFLEDGAVITAPSESENDFWETLRNSSKFDSDLPIQQYRLNFIGRLEFQEGIKWHEIWIGSDLAALQNCDFIKKIEEIKE